MVVWFIFFLKSVNLICRGVDISKYYRGSRDNEGQLLSFFLSFFRLLLQLLVTHRKPVLQNWSLRSSFVSVVDLFNQHMGCLSLHKGHPINVAIRRTVQLSNLPGQWCQRSMFRPENVSPRAGIESGTSDWHMFDQFWVLALLSLMLNAERKSS